MTPEERARRIIGRVVDDAQVHKSGLPYIAVKEFEGWLEHKLIELLLPAIHAAVQAETQRCAGLARAHKGSAQRKRIEKGRPLSKIHDDGLAVEIMAEERGEDMAAEMIADAIEKP